jgi:hypothetical protein
MALLDRLDAFFRRRGNFDKDTRDDMRQFIADTIAKNSETATSTLSITLTALDAGQIAALPNNTLYMDGSNVLKWKNNSGTSQTVTVV